MRRLITLIFAGRNRTVMIRRELPRTRDAGWVRRPDRIKRRRILLTVSSRPVTCTASGMSLANPLLNLAGHFGLACLQNLPNLLTGQLVRLSIRR